MQPVFFIKPKNNALYQYAQRFIPNNALLVHVENAPTNNTHAVLNFNKDNELVLDYENNQISIDFTKGRPNHRLNFGGGKNQPICKACGLHKQQNLTILDATAGLAQDAFVLASVNNKGNTTLIEQHPAVFSLIQNALLQDKEEQTVRDICQTMQAINCNSVDYLTTHKGIYDVIYLDPMYPERKKSAKVKKGMQLLQNIIGHEQNESAMLTAALNAAKKRVVVKRPKGAPFYNNEKPNFDCASKNTRYDVYNCATKN